MVSRCTSFSKKVELTQDAQRSFLRAMLGFAKLSSTYHSTRHSMRVAAVLAAERSRMRVTGE